MLGIKKHILTDNEYRNIIKKSPVVTVDVLFFDKLKNKVLLFKRNNRPLKNKYYSCGGRLLKNEKFIDCAIRKAWEELKIKINKKELFFGSVISEIWDDSIFSGINYHAVNIYFGCIIDEKKIKLCLDAQHSGYKWFYINDKEIHPFVKEKIVNLIKKYDKR